MVKWENAKSHCESREVTSSGAALSPGFFVEIRNVLVPTVLLRWVFYYLQPEAKPLTDALGMYQWLSVTPALSTVDCITNVTWSPQT